MAFPGLEDLLGLMARCFAYLESQGVGFVELCVMDLQDATAIARQLASEMNLTFGGYLVEAVETWLRGAKEVREVVLRAIMVFLVQIWTGTC